MMKKATHYVIWLVVLCLAAPPSIQSAAAQDSRDLLEAKRFDGTDLASMTTTFFIPKTPKMNPMIFGSLNDSVKGTTLPIALIHSPDNGWVLIRPDVAYENHTWVYGGVVDQTGQVWAGIQPFTSGFLMSPTKKLLFFVSDDQGLTFRQVTPLDIPSAYSEIRRLTVDKNKVEITLYAPDEDTEKPGYYTYRSKDGGKTWSKPEYDVHFLHDPIFDNQTPITDLMQGLLDK